MNDDADGWNREKNVQAFATGHYRREFPESACGGPVEQARFFYTDTRSGCFSLI